MKKRTVLLSALLLSSGLVSCDFLDIDTPGIVNKDKMFENEQGFIDAMNGVYASLADGDLYGEQLSFGFVDEIAQRLFHRETRVAGEPEDLALRVRRVVVNAVDGVHRAVNVVEDPVCEACLGLAVVVHLAEEDEPVGLHNALHLREQRREIRDVVQGVADADNVESVVLEIHMARIADNEVHRHTGALLSALFKHLVGAVERNDLPAASETGVHLLGKCAVARGDIECFLDMERRKLLPQFIHEGSLLLLLLDIYLNVNAPVPAKGPVHFIIPMLLIFCKYELRKLRFSAVRSPRPASCAKCVHHFPQFYKCIRFSYLFSKRACFFRMGMLYYFSQRIILL